jgi:fimbrial chaperone protein
MAGGGMRRYTSVLIAAAAWSAAALPAGAGSLQVAPVLIEVKAPGATSTLTVRNEGPRPLDAQVRIFKWRQADGEDVLEPSDAVVASPPTVTLPSRVDYSVRVVRTSRQPVDEEEAYRLVVDELPDASREKAGTVALVVRHSIPVFFMPQEASPPKLTWSVQAQGGRVTVTVRNDGGRRIRVARLRVRDGQGRTVSFGDGLLGYALAGSTMRWTRPAPRGFGGGLATISAQGDIGPIDAKAAITSAR